MLHKAVTGDEEQEGKLGFIVLKQLYKLKFIKTQNLLVPVYFHLYKKAVAFNTK